MLAQMSAVQLSELKMFFRIRRRQKEQAQIEADEANIERFFNIAEAQQRQRQSQCQSS